LRCLTVRAQQAPAGAAALGKTVDGSELDAFIAVRADGTVDLYCGKVDLGQGPLPHATGGFGTPGGKVALRADRLQRLGFDPLPFYDPPAEVADERLASRYPLCLITPKTHLFLNSTFANGKRQAAAQPRPFVILHPDDAEARGVLDGQTVRVFNDRGSFLVSVRVSEDTRRGVAVAPMGWWNTSWAGGRSCQATTPERLTPLSPCPTFNDNRVEVESA